MFGAGRGWWGEQCDACLSSRPASVAAFGQAMGLHRRPLPGQGRPRPRRMGWSNLTLAWSAKWVSIRSHLRHKAGPTVRVLEGWEVSNVFVSLGKTLHSLLVTLCRQFQGSAKALPYLLFFLGLSLSEIAAFLMWWLDQGVSPEGPRQESGGGCLTPH